ncbi:MAG: hypothetical protein KDD56_07755, partial [Bdellovibrionales bacterium]|nr:hypothetical protein [Bdellovibrionales bacterium]
DGVERFYFGDGAAAIVFSVKKTGIFSIKDAFYFGSSEGSDLINFSIFGHAKIKEDALIDRSNDQVAKIYSECLKKNQLESPQILLGSFAAESQDKLINKLELKSEQVLKNSKIGNILSAGSVCTLSENYDQIKQGDNLLCALAEGAVAAGYVLLEKH